MASYIATDGRLNDNYDNALQLFSELSELREQGLTILTGEELRVFERQTRWPGIRSS